jgi:hypothetical protein
MSSLLVWTPHLPLSPCIADTKTLYGCISTVRYVRGITARLSKPTRNLKKSVCWMIDPWWMNLSNHTHGKIYPWYNWTCGLYSKYKANCNMDITMNKVRIIFSYIFLNIHNVHSILFINEIRLTTSTGLAAILSINCNAHYKVTYAVTITHTGAWRLPWTQIVRFQLLTALSIKFTRRILSSGI